MTVSRQAVEAVILRSAFFTRVSKDDGVTQNKHPSRLAQTREHLRMTTSIYVLNN
jgi:hypothetical protein